MGPLADRTPGGVRNRGAAKRKKTRRVEAVVTASSRHATDTTRGEGDKREEGAARHEARETEQSQENMDELLQAVAKAISQAEREAGEAEEEPHSGLVERRRTRQQGAHWKTGRRTRDKWLIHSYKLWKAHVVTSRGVLREKDLLGV